MSEIILNHVRSHIDSLEWIKNKNKAIMNRKNSDSLYFQYSIIPGLNHENIVKYSERITAIRFF